MLSEGEQVYRKKAKKNKGVVLASGGWRQARVLFEDGEFAIVDESDLTATGTWVGVEQAVLAAIVKVQAGKEDLSPEALKILRSFSSARYSSGYNDGAADEINAE